MLALRSSLFESFSNHVLLRSSIVLEESIVLIYNSPSIITFISNYMDFDLYGKSLGRNYIFRISLNYLCILILLDLAVWTLLIKLTLEAGNSN